MKRDNSIPKLEIRERRMEEASPWALCCSVCRKSYGSHFEWLNHLLGQSHQNGARDECQEWTEEDKECVVVAYSSVPISPRDSIEILEKLSSLKNCTFVTDFILWKERPKVAFIQFESREKVDEMIPGGSPMKEISFDRYRIQLKRVTDMIELEWAEFFPTPSGSRRVSMSHATATDVIRKRRADSDIGDHISSPGTPVSKRRVVEETRTENVGSSHKSSSSNRILDNRASRGNIGIANLSLKVQYLVIKQEVQIPEDEFKKALEVIRSVEESLNEHFPNCKMYMFRHWYLQIKNSGTNELSLFLDAQGIWGQSWETDVLEGLSNGYKYKFYGLTEKIADILQSGNNISRASKTHINRANSDPFGMCFHHKKCRVYFNLFLHPVLILETQTCRMLKYLSEFDPRVTGLIALINYWAKVNNILLASSVVTNRVMLPFIGAEPISLEWMVVSFLISEKTIPSVRDILERPHSSLVFKNQDIGFSEDVDYAKEWIEKHNPPKADSDDFVMSVLSLACRFFELYGNISSHSCILNTKDGELIDLKHFLKTPCSIATKLTADEQELVRKPVAEFRERRPHKRIFNAINPLFLKSALNFDNLRFFLDWKPLFLQTVNKLKPALQSYAESSHAFDLKAVLDCKCID